MSDAKAKPTQIKMSPNHWYVDGVAYDFTAFAKKHPGGEYALYLAKGQEGRSLIESYHMTPPSQSLMDKYRLPADQQIQHSEWVKFAPAIKFTYDHAGFFNTLKKEVKNHFRTKGISYKAPWSHVLMFVANVLLQLWCLYRMVADRSIMFALLHGFFRAILVMQTTHGASHFAFSSKPMVNRWAYRLGTVLIGLWCPKRTAYISLFLSRDDQTWDYQHIVAHHIYTNEWPYDTDSAFPFKSILHNQRRLGFHKYQHLYIWVIYALTIPLVMLNSLRELANERQATFKMAFDVKNSRLEAWACSIGAIVYLLVPFLCLPFWLALGLSLVSNVFSSLMFSLQFVVNHEVDSVVSDGPPPAEVDFGAYQLTQALTFSPDNRLALELAGGLNTQIEHHLFPCVHYSHYNDIGRIVRRVAKDFGLKYDSRPNWWQAVTSHYNLLRNPPKSTRESKRNKSE